jgi:ubiquinone/menaquinone biosynthesis C-methylase UbiE
MKLACPVCHKALLWDFKQESKIRTAKCCGEEYLDNGSIIQLLPPNIMNNSAYAFEINRYSNKVNNQSGYDGFLETKPKQRAELMAKILKDEQEKYYKSQKKDSNSFQEYVEVGPGYGYVFKETEGIRRIALDACSVFLKLIKSQIPRITCVSGIAESLPFASESVECLICESSFQSVYDRRMFLYEIARVLMSGGLLVLTIAHKWHYRPPRKPQDGFNIIKEDEYSTLRLFIEELGFAAEYKYLSLETMDWVESAWKNNSDYLYIIARKK